MKAPEKGQKEGRKTMKKFLLAFTLMFTLLACCLTGCNTDAVLDAEKANASAVFTLDVNPGVRIYVKSDNSVISVEATNEDGDDVVSELDVVGEDYELVVEEIVDKLNEKGYIENEESSVLISIEKNAEGISEKINGRLEKAFEKHGKKACVIEQKLEKIDEEIEKTIEKIAKKHRISEGKAHLIEKIREEFPELSEEELAKLNVNELAIMLHETSDDVKGHFEKLEKAVEHGFVAKEQALANALASLEISESDVKMQRVRIVHEEGKLYYEVEFVYDGMEYEITVEAKTGVIVETESEEFEEFDAEGFIKDFCDRHEINPDEFKDQIINGIFGNEGQYGDKKPEHTDEKRVSKGELLKGILEKLNIAADSLKKTDVRIYEAESGTVYSVMLETDGGDVYRIVVEAYSGSVIKAELNGNTLDIAAEIK